MATAFTVDRRGSLDEGQLLERVRIELSPAEIDIDKHLSHEYSEGLSQHGVSYLFRADQDPALFQNQGIEHFFELARRIYRPNAPSRFQSMFGTESVEEARVFRDEMARNNAGPADAPIRELHFETDAIRVDMLGLNQTTVASRAITYRTMRYWRGEPNGAVSCQWELIIPLPIRVGRTVSE